jgi:hypothetical protein
LDNADACGAATETSGQVCRCDCHWQARALALGAALCLAAALAGAETAKRGGILKFVVPDAPPSFDGQRETTFALIHPIAPSIAY